MAAKAGTEAVKTPQLTIIFHNAYLGPVPVPERGKSAGFFFDLQQLP